MTGGAGRLALQRPRVPARRRRASIAHRCAEIGHVGCRLATRKGQHQFIHPGAAIARGRGGALAGGAGDGKGIDEPVVENAGGRFAPAKPVYRIDDIRFGDPAVSNDRVAQRRPVVADGPERRQHAADRGLGGPPRLVAVRPRDAWDVLHDLGPRSARTFRFCFYDLDGVLGISRRAHVGHDQPIRDATAERQAALAHSGHVDRHMRPRRAKSQGKLSAENTLP